MADTDQGRHGQQSRTTGIADLLSYADHLGHDGPGDADSLTEACLAAGSAHV